MLTGKQIRQMFIKYFEDKGHTHVASSSLVPYNDPTLLFTNAGMNQFKDVFLGLEKRDYTRATTSQKCVRAGGKHNDLDTVGRTARHHTFFEMLGNFSFGDYFKRDAIKNAWGFLTEELKLPIDKLYITIYNDDDEAHDLWRELSPVPEERIIRLGEKDNFWQMGETGPCGPCSEIHIDRGAEFACNHPDGCALGVCDCDRWLEIWNLVFMQYNRDENGVMTPLPRPSIDTGMGLERITSVMQNVSSNYDTDLIYPLIEKVEEISGKTYDRGQAGFPFRVIADHARSCTFLICDGVLPSNEGRGYVLRRILRRAVRFGKTLGIEGAFLYKFSAKVVELMGEDYPELAEKLSFIEKVIKTEEERFQMTLSDGIRIVNDNIARLKAEGKTEIDGPTAFTFYDTYGFPIDLTQDMAEESGMTVDEKGFEEAMKAQRELSKKSKKDITAWDLAFTVKEQLGDLDKTEFIGYEQLSTETVLAGMIADGQKIEEAEEGQEVYVVLPVTPFYAMSGGQAGDHGVISGATGKIVVDNTEKMPDGKYVHHGVVSGTVVAGETVTAQVDEAVRQATARNHTATHLLHKALQEVLGDHVHQAGSSVDAQRLRFDFSHMSAVTAEELAKVEAKVNEVILQAIPVNIFETGIEEAKKLGFTALFGEKYGDVVRCVQAGDYSMELCGGTHVANISQIGLFKVVSEGAVAAGVRRVEAVTGMGAYQYALQKEQLLAELGRTLKTPEKDLISRVEQLGAQNKELEKEIAQLHAAASKNQVDGLLDNVKEVNGVKLLACEVEAADMNSLRDMSDMFRDKLGSGVVVLGAKSESGVNLIVAATKDLTKQGIHAGNIIKEIAKVTGGGGGGRPDMAQAGGKDYTRLAEALAMAETLVAGQLK
ncbi:MAG: alanine--tRNA ligase [Peptococcaceae bacterium]|nr:alanine--tRNA ligase [Peptococcaceae bacterium]MBQ5652719.1 alanine--tRNA ligase [Peptococcaceae bacterium]